MDDFWLWSGLVQDMVFGALGGLAAYILTSLLGRSLGGNGFVKGLIYAVCIILALAIGGRAANQHRLIAEVDRTMQVLKTHKIYAALFKYHPGTEATLRNSLTDILRTAPDNQQLRARAGAVTRNLVDPYLTKDLMNAPDDAIHGLLASDLDLEAKLQVRPEVCVAYFMGRPPGDTGLLSADDFERQSDARGAVIEGAATRPSPPPAHPDVRLYSRQVVQGFRAKGYDLHDLAFLAHLDEAEPAQGCRTAIEYTSVLVAMPDAQASAILKGLAELAPH